MSTQHGPFHFGRSWWPGKWIEAECPCPKAPCGLVRGDEWAEECDQHNPEFFKTMREIHHEDRCQERMTEQ